MSLLDATKKPAMNRSKKRVTSLPSAPKDTTAGAKSPVIPVDLPRHVKAALRGIMRRDLGVNLGSGVALLLTVLPALWLLQALIDWSFDLPWVVRLFLLVADAGAVMYVILRFLVRSWRRRLTFETAALRAETAIPALRSGLISAVELSAARHSSMPGSLSLVRECIERVARQIQKMNLPQRVISSSGFWRQVGVAAVVLAIAAGATAFFWPKSEVLLQRLFLSRVPLPTRTVVVAITRNESVIVGEDLALSARAQGVIPKSGRVTVVYADNSEQELPATPTTDDPAIFVVPMKNVQQSYHYRFTLNDGSGQEFIVTAKTPPSLASFRCTQTYPHYTGMADAEMTVGNLAFLSGSHIRLEGHSTQPLTEAILQLEGMNQQVKLEVRSDDTHTFRGEFTVPRAGLTGFSIHLVNTEGVPSIDDTVYPIDLIQDKPPVITISLPLAEHQSVLLRGKPRLVYSVSDDFGLQKVSLKYNLVPPAHDGGPAPPSTSGEIPLPVPKQGGSGAGQTYIWDIAAQNPPWSEGCTATYWIEATDNNDVTGPGVTQSSRKTITVVSEAAKRAEILDELGLRGKDLEDLYNSQKTLNQQIDSSLQKNQP